MLLLGLRCFPHIDVLPIRVERPRNPVLLNPSPQYPDRRPNGFFGEEARLGLRGSVIDHMHQAASPSSFFQPIMKAPIHLH